MQASLPLGQSLAVSPSQVPPPFSSPGGLAIGVDFLPFSNPRDPVAHGKSNTGWLDKIHKHLCHPHINTGATFDRGQVEAHRAEGGLPSARIWVRLGAAESAHLQ